MELQNIKNRYGIIGNSPALNRALEVSLRVAPTDLSVLITGESGVGKEFFPQIIHHNSSRKHNNYIAVNCGAIPQGTIDSELFGHEKGSFTGASEARKGYFEEADGGTIFLDEVAELPLTTQVRLLRVLQSGEFIRVGSSRAQKTDVRVVAATNINLFQAIENGRFREDLYYRLNTVPITVPPLRERRADIYMLFKKFATDIASEYRLSPINLSDGARLMLEGYSWPGNVRQLKNVAEQVSAIEQGQDIKPDVLEKYLPDYNPKALPMLSPSSCSANNENQERDILYKLLFDLRGEVSELKVMMSQMTQSSRTTTIESPVHENVEYVDAVEENPEQSSVVLTTTPQSKEQAQREQVIAALKRNRGNRREAASELFMSERTLYRKIKDLGIE
ncbi:MAG: sigma-54 dependent transcriptional regulator [Mucinivorans sp.]